MSVRVQAVAIAGYARAGVSTSHVFVSRLRPEAPNEPDEILEIRRRTLHHRAA